jgi:hypothetical protein
MCTCLHAASPSVDAGHASPKRLSRFGWCAVQGGALHGRIRATHNRGAIGGRMTPLVVGRRGMVMVAVAGVRSAMHQLLT